MLENLINSSENLAKFSPVSTYFIDGSKTDELIIESRKRNDILLNLNIDLDIDVLCEEFCHHTETNEITIENLLEISKKESTRFEHSIGKYINFIKDVLVKVQMEFIEFPKGNFNAVYNRVNVTDVINSETKFFNELEKIVCSIKKAKMVEEHCIELINDLRSVWYGLEENESRRNLIEKEIKKSLLNIRNFRLASNMNDLNDIQLRLLSVDTRVENTMSILNNNVQHASKTNEDIDINLSNKKSLYDLYCIINDPLTTIRYEEAIKQTKKWMGKKRDKYETQEKYEKGLKKALTTQKSSSLPSAYSITDGTRPNSDFTMYECWNGFQAFDIDIKECRDEKLDENGNTVYHYTIEEVLVMKKQIHEKLSKYSWYLCTKSSISKRGFHIFTKIKPMHKLYTNLKSNKSVNSFWFKMSYYHKYTIIKWILHNVCKISDKKVVSKTNSKSYLNRVIDASMMKITQGIVLNTDLNSLWNKNFLELPLIYGLHLPPSDGIVLEDWILEKSNLRDVLVGKIIHAKGHDKLKGRVKKGHTATIIAESTETITYEFSSVEMPLLENVTPIDERKFPSRDSMRHKVVRTVIYLYGVSDESKNLCRHLLKTNDVWSEQEFLGKWRYARKKPFIFMNILNLLKACGCNFEMSEEVLAEIKDTKLHKAVEALKDSDVEFSEIMPNYSYVLDKNNPYLGSLKNVIVSSLESDKINVLESGSGTGKTTLFNMLSAEFKVCLVCPYVAVLKNKVESDPIASKKFKTFHSGKKIKPKDIKGSIATTFDTFLQMSEDDYKKFDIIAIDESHLLFTSAFRGSVPPDVIYGVRKFVEMEMSKKANMNMDIGMVNEMGGIMADTMLYKTMNNSGTKIVLMTGTITGELLYFKTNQTLNYVKINSVHKYGKHANMVLCDSHQNKVHTIVKSISRAIDLGKTVIVPTNRGDEYIQGILAQVNHMSSIGVTEKEYGYYSKNTVDQEVCHKINTESLLPNKTKLLFCTVYLGVGVDIINEKEFHLVFDGDETTAQDIEQYNNRVRRSFISCDIIYTALHNNIGGISEIKKGVYDSPSEIELKNQTDFAKEIHDDKIIAKSNKRISQNDEYAQYKLPDHLDLREVYHDITPDGIVFNKDKFLINNFSREFNNIAKNPSYTKYVLNLLYGYDIDYKVSIMDKIKLKEELDVVSKMAKKEVVNNKSKAFLETIDFCVNNYDKIDNKGIIKFKPLKDNKFVVSIDNYDINEDDSDKFEYILKYSMSFEKQFKMAFTRMRKLLKVYKPNKCSDFLRTFIGKSGRINSKELTREMRLLSFLKQSKDKDLLMVTADIFHIVDKYLRDEDGINFVEKAELGTFILEDFSYSGLKSLINIYADKYFNVLSNESGLVSIKRRNEMFDKSEETLKTIFKVKKTKDGYIKLITRKIPPFDKLVPDTNHLDADFLLSLLKGDIILTEDKKSDVNVDDFDNRKLPTEFESKTEFNVYEFDI